MPKRKDEPTQRIRFLSTQPPQLARGVGPYDQTTVNIAGGISSISIPYPRAKKLLQAAGFEQFAKLKSYSTAELREKFPLINWQLLCVEEMPEPAFVGIKAFYSYSLDGNKGILVARIFCFSSMGNLAFIHLGDEPGKLTLGVIYNLEEWVQLDIQQVVKTKISKEEGVL